MTRLIQYGTHLAAALAAVTTGLQPSYGQARWFVILPAITMGLAALGIVPATQQARASQASTPTSASSQS